MSIKFATFNGRPTHVVISFTASEVEAAAYVLSRAGLEKSAQALLNAVNMGSIQTEDSLIMPNAVLTELSDTFTEEATPLVEKAQEKEYFPEVQNLFNHIAEGHWAVFTAHIMKICGLRLRDL